ncbi:hypothetical protein CLACE_22340 [Clostridium acetobutylicum]|nr:hypothetical protein CLACE_22340 [Clostridium acetobutylicum]
MSVVAAFATVTAQEAVFPSEEAVTLAVPSFKAVILPLLSTETMLESEEVQVMFLLFALLERVADNVSVSPTFKLSVDLLRLIEDAGVSLFLTILILRASTRRPLPSVPASAPSDTQSCQPMF